MYRVACLTPEDECGGAVTEVNANLKGQGRPRKLHATHIEAFHCHVNYLMRTGHQQIVAIRLEIKTCKYSWTHMSGRHKGKIPEPEKRKHIQALQAAVRNIKMLRHKIRRR